MLGSERFRVFIFMEVSNCLVGPHRRIKAPDLWLLEGSIPLGIVNLHHLHSSGTGPLVRLCLRKVPGK